MPGDSPVDWKERTREQWSTDPCGAETGGEAGFGSREYFESIERTRYLHQPWMKRDIGFDRYAGKRLLEVGVGMGTDHLQWARGGAICTGIDLTPRCIEITKRRFEVYGQKSELHVMDAEKLAFPDESFDVVYSFGVLHHTPGTQEAIDEIHRVLKPGGRAIVMLYHRDSLHMLRLAVFHGLVKGEFAHKSIEDLLGESEYAADRKALPLVKVYSRGEALFLFRRFRKVDNIVRQLNRDELEACRNVGGHSASVSLHARRAPLEVVPNVDPAAVIFNLLNPPGTELTDGAVEELGKLVGWNVVLFAGK